MAVPVSDPSQVGSARRAAQGVAAAARLGERASSNAAIVAAELATNLVRYGREGALLVQALTPASGDPAMEILAVDRGPGMPDSVRCLVDGYSTGGTPGTGLGAVKRLSDEFDLYSIAGAGTVVFSRIRNAAPPAASGFHYAAVSMPAPNEEACGDAWRVVQRNGVVSVMVADGLGHGPLAAQASTRAAELFEQNGLRAPGEFLERAHAALRGTRGAAVAVALVSSEQVVAYAGFGNICGAIAGAGHSRGLPSQNGTVGVVVPRVLQTTHEWSAGFLIMHSDGLTSRWSLDAYPGVFGKHPGVAAGLLYRDHVRGKDDATVVVVARSH